MVVRLTHERCQKFCWAEAGWLILMGQHLISAGKVTLRDGRQVDELIMVGDMCQAHSSQVDELIVLEALVVLVLVGHVPGAQQLTKSQLLPGNITVQHIALPVQSAITKFE